MFCLKCHGNRRTYIKSEDDWQELRRKKAARFFIRDQGVEEGWKRSEYPLKVWMAMAKPEIPDQSLMVFRRKMSHFSMGNPKAYMIK
ncbi:MAG: hypothetical protein AABY87_09010 [bacterium]